MVHTLGALVVFAGIAMLVLGAIAFVIAEFRESVLWGIGGLLFAPINLAFLILNWERAKNAFFLQLYGFGFVLLGAVAFHAHVPIIG
jgi:hypothetical protein